MIRAVLFDKDGCLFDFTRSWAAPVRAALENLARDDAALLRRLGEAVGFDIESETFAAGAPVVSGDAMAVGRALLGTAPSLSPAAVQDAVIAASGPDWRMSPACDLPEMLDALRAQGRMLGVATNDNEAPARAQLASVGALNRFAAVYGADSGHGAKPGPGMAQAFLRATGVAAAQAAMVGDSPGDLTSAAAAGYALRIGVLTGPAGRDDLAPYADIVLDNVASLPEWLCAQKL